jgi:hypothetical protein
MRKQTRAPADMLRVEIAHMVRKEGLDPVQYRLGLATAFALPIETVDAMIAEYTLPSADERARMITVYGDSSEALRAAARDPLDTEG